MQRPLLCNLTERAMEVFVCVVSLGAVEAGRQRPPLFQTFIAVNGESLNNWSDVSRGQRVTRTYLTYAAAEPSQKHSRLVPEKHTLPLTYTGIWNKLLLNFGVLSSFFFFLRLVLVNSGTATASRASSVLLLPAWAITSY